MDATTTTTPAPFVTHEVRNQSVPLEGWDRFAANLPLLEALRREGGEWAEDRACEVGRLAGDGDVQRLGVQANEHPPVLHTHDRFGHRIDEVEFHPAWHELLRLAVAHDLHDLPWREPRPGAHVARAAMFMTFSTVEAGHGCPVSMTYSAVPALRASPGVLDEWLPRAATTTYDPRFIPAAEKRGALLGMAMTEKQGGSDVRANTTEAVPDGEDFRLTGHKWFCSAPMCDAFLVLAQSAAGLSCFLVPRFTPDGERNPFHLQRLKDKLGNRSNASSEVEFRGTWGRLVGEEGRGVPTIIEMVGHTRLDCVIGAAAGMRLGVEQALWHAEHRSAFGGRLVEQPLMRNVLADLCVESEAATVTAMRLARAYDDSDQVAFRRVATAVAKYWCCKRAVAHAGEALECLGGNGYVEASGMPRLFRESPLNGIWEGSGNVIALDVLRALVRAPATLEAFHAELTAAAGADPRLDAHVASLAGDFADAATLEARARRVVERMALALQGSLLVRFGDPAVADAFCASRLGGDWGHAFGTLPAGADLARIIDRHRVHAPA